MHITSNNLIGITMKTVKVEVEYNMFEIGEEVLKSDGSRGKVMNQTELQSDSFVYLQDGKTYNSRNLKTAPREEFPFTVIYTNCYDGRCEIMYIKAYDADEAMKRTKKCLESNWHPKIVFAGNIKSLMEK